MGAEPSRRQGDDSCITVPGGLPLIRSRARVLLLASSLGVSGLALAACVPPAPAACDPNYSGCVPISSDVDCLGGTGDGPAYVAGPVQVIGADIYGLDRDRDGIGCEASE